MAAPDLRVVQGNWTANKKWLDFPAQVTAPALLNKNDTNDFRVAKDDAVKAARAKRRTPVFEFWSIVNGTVPPVPNASADDSDLICLLDAHASYLGIQRPLGADDDGSNIAAYILKPTHFYSYVPGMACCAEKKSAPDDAVFVVYARLDEPFSVSGHCAKGILTHWQFVRADSNDPMLPVDHASRYGRRLW